MLASETESVLLELMGDQYQGGNPDGLPLRHDGSAFYHEGMKASAQNFGTLDPESMAPDGYRIPDYRGDRHKDLPQHLRRRTDSNGDGAPGGLPLEPLRHHSLLRL